MDQQLKAWIAKTEAILVGLEAKLQAKRVPVLRGVFREDGVAIVDVEQLDDATLALVVDEQSLCVMDGQRSLSLAQDDSDLEDINIYLRLGNSNTWIHLCLEAPYEGANSDDDGVWWGGGQQELSIDAKTLQSLAMRVALATGFGSLRNKQERKDFSEATCGAFPDTKLNSQDLWEIASLADTYFTLGVLPSRAKMLEKDGKSLVEIVRMLGVSKARAERALSAAIPAHIVKLL
jgi:hypothetical protein